MVQLVERAERRAVDLLSVLVQAEKKKSEA